MIEKRSLARSLAGAAIGVALLLALFLTWHEHRRWNSGLVLLLGLVLCALWAGSRSRS